MNVDVLIIGAGPAGLAAAQALTARSVSVCIVDEAEDLGGQISRGREDHRLDTDARLWQRLAGVDGQRSLLPPTVTYLPRTTALGFEDHAGPESGWDENTGLVSEATGGKDTHWVWINSQDRGLEQVCARAVLIATGAYDLPVPLPGWHLPGVMGIGGLEILLKSGGFDGGSRGFLLAGSHPLLLLAARRLVQQGHRVECVALDLHPRWRNVMKTLPGPEAVLAKLPALATSLASLAKARVPVLWNASLVDVARMGSGLGVNVRRRKKMESFTCDYVGLGYGFLANTHLARQAGCESSFDLRAGGWIVEGRHARTSVPGIFVAGEQTGISGAEAAAAEGWLAGLMISAYLDASSVTSRDLKRATRRAAQWNRLGRFLREWAHHDEAWLASRLEGDPLMCRCEGLHLSQVLAPGTVGLSNMRQTKLTTRVGMGPCQGRVCGPVLSSLAVQARADPQGLTPQFPIEPINMPTSSLPLEER